MKKKRNFKKIIIFTIILLILLTTGVFAATGFLVLENNYDIEHGVGSAGAVVTGTLKYVFTERKDEIKIIESSADDIDTSSRVDGKSFNDLVVYEYGGYYKTGESGAVVEGQNVLTEELAQKGRKGTIKTITELLDFLNDGENFEFYGWSHGLHNTGMSNGKYALYNFPNFFCLYHGQQIGKWKASITYLYDAYGHYEPVQTKPSLIINKNTPIGTTVYAQSNEIDYFEGSNDNPWGTVNPGSKNEYETYSLSSAVSGLDPINSVAGINNNILATNEEINGISYNEDLTVNSSLSTDSVGFVDPIDPSGGPYLNRWDNRKQRVFRTSSNVVYYLNAQSPEATPINLYKFNNGLGVNYSEVDNKNTVSYGVAFSSKITAGHWERAQADIWCEMGDPKASSGSEACSPSADGPSGVAITPADPNPDDDLGDANYGEGYTPNKLCLFKAGSALDLYENALTGGASIDNHNKAVVGTDTSLRNKAIVSTKNQESTASKDLGTSKDATGTTVIMDTAGNYTTNLSFSVQNIDTGAGSTDSLSGEYFYRIGPFKMSDYVYAASEHVKDYSGRDVEKYKALLGGIIYGDLTFKDDSDTEVKTIEIGNNESGTTKAKIVYEKDTTDYTGSEPVRSTGANYLDNNFCSNTSSRREITLDKGKSYYYYTDYEYPRPNSTFYIVIPVEECGPDATSLSKINFIYRQTYSTGDGWIINSKYVYTKWTATQTGADGCSDYYTNCEGTKNTSLWRTSTYPDACDFTTIYTGNYCQADGGTHYHAWGDCNAIKGTKGTAYNGSGHKDVCTGCHCTGCYKPWYTPSSAGVTVNCYTSYQSGGGYYTDPVTPSGWVPPTYDWSADCECSTEVKHECDNFAFCQHGYRWCRKTTKYQGEGKVIEGQPFLAVHKSRVALRDYVYTAEVNIRLTTDITVNKYISDVEHVESTVLTASGIDTTLTTAEGDTRKDLDKATKEANQVYVEYGDVVTYKITLTNEQKASVDVKIKDILPEYCKFISITNNGADVPLLVLDETTGDTVVDQYFRTDWVEVPGNTTTELIVKIRVDSWEDTDTSGRILKWVNEARMITTNYGNDGKDGVPPNGRDKAVTTVDYIRVHVPESPLPGPVVNNAEIRDIENLVNYDWYSLNNYNLFIDKYVDKYNEEIHIENNSDEFTFTKEDSIVDSANYNKLLTSRENVSTTTSTVSNGDILDIVRDDNGAQEQHKEEHPVSMEKEETFTYAIKVTNEAQTINTKQEPSGIKKATQARPTKITDLMQEGLDQKNVTAVVYNADGTECTKYGDPGLQVISKGTTSEDGVNFNVYEYTINNNVILNPDEYIIYYVDVQITASDAYLFKLKNTAQTSVITNINHEMLKDDDGSDIPYIVKTPDSPERDENIALQEESSEYIRLKDYVIAGKVWLDFNKNGLMDDKIEDYIAQTTTVDGESLYRANPDKLKEYHDINDDAMMEGITVKLYRKEDETTPVRTTKTDSNGLFTFSRDENLSWHESGYNHDKQYSAGTTYQRVDKAEPKDANGNYTESSQNIEYFVEYEYDGVIYKATAYSGKDHLNDNGSYKGAACNHSFETNTSEYLTDDYEKESKPSGKYKYEYDSNANEFVSVREDFNTKYEYFTYNHAYSISGSSEPGSDLDFDKTNHTSQLLVNHERAMKARSFIEHISQANTPEATNYIALFKYDSSDVTIPYSRYLKFINLGLELREDVDISLTKDVYKVKTTIKGQDMEYNFNKNFIINGKTLSDLEENNFKLDKPYGIELYESDYKYRKDQYASVKAVEDYLGETSELNVEVTYRIRVNNNHVHKDDDLKSPDELTGSYDKKNFEDTDKTELFVKVDELIDLYDENFIEYTEAMENGSEEDFIRVRELDENTGRFKAEDKQIKIAEAWYFAPDDSGNYVLDNATGVYVDTAEGTVKNPEQKYKLVPLVVSNNSKKGSLNEYINANGYETDGYHKLYIRPRTEEEAFVIEEGGHCDFFVKYVLDKNFEEESTITNESFEETKTKATTTTSGTGLTTGDDGSITVSWYKSTSSAVTNGSTISIIRSLILKEHTDTAMKQEFGLDTENIAQVNMYSVWYDKDATKPTSIVDKDSNAGNVGMKDTMNAVIDSADNKAIYEDTIYKTGIKITAKGTANLPPDITKIYMKDQGSITLNQNIIRSINGHVWDDSRSEKIQEQFIGNGLRHNGTAQNEAKTNDLVPIILKETTGKLDEREEKDIDVPSAKAEFIEIIETDANTYYEMVPSDVMCKYQQHIRTDNDGKYELYGYAPGKYVVRFTYGDDIEGGSATEQDNMYLFNGQDYKSTKYTMPEIENPEDPTSMTGNVVDDNIILYNKDENENNINKVIASLEAQDYNDARDDEIRRLEVNGYSEVMDNMMAEILQGKANGQLDKDGKYLTNNKDVNTSEELKALVDNTWMFAETIPFTVRAEKIDKEMRERAEKLLETVTYASREQLENQLTYTREFKIQNIDFGIEYRPENSVQLEKEIKEVKIVTESGETVIDLHFYTEYEPDYTKNNVSMKTHHLDTEKSVGLDMIQFISNEYSVNDLVSKLITEDSTANQGFVYINYDVDIQQGATIEITYEFTAENHGEADKIAKNLDNIRYQKNPAATSMNASVISNEITGSKNNNGTTNYRANITAANDMINNLYKRDAQGIFYRTSPKVLTELTATIDKPDKRKTPESEAVDANGASRNKLSYYGYYAGYEYYTGIENADFDTVAELKFNKILDYVDKDMLYLDNTKGEETTNKTWSILDNTYKEYYSTIDWARSNPTYVASLGENCSKDDILNYVNNKIKALNVASAYKEMQNTDGLTADQSIKTEIGEIKGASIDPEGYIYENMLLSTDTGMYTDVYVDANRTLISEANIPDGTNPSLSRFLIPMVTDTNTYLESRGKIDLTVSKAISAETSDDELEYQNIAEIVEFTTLTGRRTNFAITIGNVDVRIDDTNKIKPDVPTTPLHPNTPNNPKEYHESTPEPDESTAEVVTLIPPQGLYGTNKVIREVVEIAKTGSQIVVIIVALVVIGVFGTTFAIRKYNKRRIK